MTGLAALMVTATPGRDWSFGRARRREVLAGDGAEPASALPAPTVMPGPDRSSRLAAAASRAVSVTT
ncbi:hypothetical protein [Streptomyces swartbergensis]|uniref:Uncharacterized protein n=1 Tax=Streptomyces swartbergensis TaxID=487165 RepID=A0A243S7M4_9ACTN|nr:hypothetical protein [Streptomyces swartbergensis]OUD03602.1 hypothetical protein CA983_08860 [Streptomyces swartbergensis]